MQLIQVIGRQSPRTCRPLRRKKSSGASRPIMEKTSSLGKTTSVPSSFFRVTLSGSIRVTFVASASVTEPGGAFFIISLVKAVVTRSELGRSTCTSAFGSCSSILSFSTFSGFGPRELRFAITDRDPRARAGQRDGRFQRAVAPADHEHVFPAKILRVEKPVIDLVEIFARAAELAMISAPPDRHDDSPRARLRFRLVAVVEQNFFPARFESLDPRLGKFDPRRLPLRFHFLEQRLFHILGELESALQFQIGRVGVDRFRFGKVRDGRERLGGFEDLEIQTRFLRLDRGRDARDAAPDDGKVENFAFAFRLLPWQNRARPESRAPLPRRSWRKT